MRWWIAAVVTMMCASGAGCVGQPQDSPGCCFQACSDDSTVSFNTYTAWFGDDELCARSAESICFLEDMGESAVPHHEWVPVVLDPADEDAKLSDACRSVVPDWYGAYLEED